MQTLFDYEIKGWLENQYPTTIVRDRYSGCYSGALWLAFPYEFCEIDPAVCDGDPDCWHFWDTYKGFVGKGSTIEDAVNNLRLKLMQEQESGFPNSLKLNEILNKNKL